MRWLRNPWGKPRFLPVFTAAYIIWSIVPVLIAVQFSFNATRSRTVWDSFSTRWYWGDPVDSVWHDPTLRHALVQTFKLAGADVLIGGSEERHWKGEPMVSMLPHDKWVTREEARALVDWILAAR